MIKTLVVLSAPSTASSLVAEALSNKIYMGSHNNNGHYENEIMLKLSQDILAYAKEIDKEDPLIPGYIARRDWDPWDNPPSEAAILASEEKFKDRIIATVKNEGNQAVHNEAIKNPMGYAGNPAKFWGWKDGRIGLIIPLIGKHLPNPHYMFLHRGVEATANAIAKRQEIAGYPIGVENATILVKEYHRRILKFLDEQQQ